MFHKNYIVFITVICGLALMGLIFIQFYWINSAIQQRETELEDKIVLSMGEVVENVAKYEAFSVMQRNDPNTIINKLGVNFNGNLYFDSANNSYHFNSNALSVNAQNQLFSNLLNELFSLGRPQDINARLPKEVLDSLIHTIFEKNNIDTDLFFGVFDIYNDKAYSNTSKTTALLSSQYKMDLFPGDAFGTPYYLSIILPNQRSFVIKSMWLMLGGSALFILIIIYAFYHTISTIVEQKKLSLIKNDFINNMTHELKTPISTISLACEALNDTGVDKTEETQHRFVNMISDENKRLGVLVENVLQSAVIERGELKLKKETLDVHQIINKAVSNIAIQVQKRNGTITLKNKAVNTKVLGDKVHITNVVYNLLDNANKYSAQSPRITIETMDLVGGVILRIKDNGIGIDKENQDKVFEKLYRVPTGDRHDVKGFGLGLSYVKSIIEKHGGEITLESTLGKGSSFNIYLPTQKIKAIL